MKEWIIENLNWLVPSAVSLFSGSSFLSIFSLVKSIHARKAVKNALEKAKADSYYTTCPHCKSKIYLEDTKWHMPNGDVDDDLDGIKD